MAYKIPCHDFENKKKHQKKSHMWLNITSYKLCAVIQFYWNKEASVALILIYICFRFL